MIADLPPTPQLEQRRTRIDHLLAVTAHVDPAAGTLALSPDEAALFPGRPRTAHGFWLLGRRVVVTDLWPTDPLAPLP
jgi:hypothetical protein